MTTSTRTSTRYSFELSYKARGFSYMKASQANIDTIVAVIESKGLKVDFNATPHMLYKQGLMGTKVSGIHWDVTCSGFTKSHVEAVYAMFAHIATL